MDYTGLRCQDAGDAHSILDAGFLNRHLKRSPAAILSHQRVVLVGICRGPPQRKPGRLNSGHIRATLRQPNELTGGELKTEQCWGLFNLIAALRQAVSSHQPGSIPHQSKI